MIKTNQNIFFTYRRNAMVLQGNLQGIQHLGIPVTDLERSRDFYMQLGFTEAMRKDIPRKSEPVRVAMMEHENFTIELYQLDKERRQEIATRSDGHIDHVALNVLDIEQAYTEIKALGLEILEDNAPVYLPFWEHGVRYFTVRGPDGEKIEFNQILK
jgi:lactoylglutathione lyase